MAFITSVPLVASGRQRAAIGKVCRADRETGATTPAWRVTSASSGLPSNFNITLLPGDGIGPEIMSSTVSVLEAVASRFSLNFTMNEALIGGAAIDALNVPFPEETVRQCRKSDSILLACIGGPKWDSYPRELRPESGLLAMRSELGLFANLRPAKVMSQLLDASTLKRDVVRDVDIMVVRELTGDVYFGRPTGLHVRDDGSGKRVGYNTMIYTEEEIERVAHVGFRTARSRSGRLTSVDKANVLDVSQLWRDVVNELSADYEDVQLSHMYVDNAAMQLIREPRQFDTILTGNMFGDILSDAASMLVGSLGMLPSASLGGNAAAPGVFEPVHGSAPDIAGENKANPSAMVLSAAMMMRYDLGRADVAEALEKAVDDVLHDGLRTGDIMTEGATLAGCKEFGDAIAAKVLCGAEAAAV